LNLISFHERVKHSGFNSFAALDLHKDAVLTGPWKTVKNTYHSWAVKPRRSGRGYKACLSKSVILTSLRPQDLGPDMARSEASSQSSALATSFAIGIPAGTSVDPRAGASAAIETDPAG
jgi:hypothetical protein